MLRAAIEQSLPYRRLRIMQSGFKNGTFASPRRHGSEFTRQYHWGSQALRRKKMTGD
jgi:hypothetical protein